MDVIKVEPESDEDVQMSSDIKEEEDLGCSLLKSEDCTLVDFKDEPFSDDDTEPLLSLVDVQQSDMQEEISEPCSFIAVKNAIQEEAFYAKEDLKDEETVEESTVSIHRHFMDTPMKKPRTIMTLGTKLNIIQRLENGETAASLGRFYNVNESSIRTIKKNAERIRNSVAQSCSSAAKKIVRVRNPLLEKIEKMLAIWVEDQNKKRMTVNSRIIRTKALKLYEHLQQRHRDSSSAEPFAASKGDYRLQLLLHTEHAHQSSEMNKVENTLSTAESEDRKSVV